MNTPDSLKEALAALARRPGLHLALLFGLTFGLAKIQHPRKAAFQARNSRHDDPLSSLLGDGRKLFANHFYTKADVYFHSGFYPTILDNQESHRTAHMAEDAGVTSSKNTGDEEQFLGPVRNWIDAHGRKHFPSVHTHLGQDSPDGRKSVEREILPWLRFSSKLDPNRVETYTVAAYWLRRTGGHVEAEQFLREGLRANPDSPEILFELGRCREDASDSDRARNIWELAWRHWQERESAKPVEERDRFLASQLLIHLARLESRAGHRDRCLHWLSVLLPLKPNPEEIRKRIAEVQAGLPLGDTDDAPGQAGKIP